LTGLETPSKGAIYLKNQEILPSSLHTLRQEMGMIFQHFQLFSSRNVFNNIAYGLEIRGISLDKREARVEELIHLVGLDHKKFHFPRLLNSAIPKKILSLLVFIPTKTRGNNKLKPAMLVLTVDTI